MAKPIMLKIRLSESQMAAAERLSKEAGLSVSEWARSRMFGDEWELTTAAKIATPKRKPGKLCPACAKAGRARWNCQVCRPEKVGAA